MQRDEPMLTRGDEVKLLKEVEIPFPESNDRKVVLTLPEGFVGEVYSEAIPNASGSYAYDVRFPLTLGPTFREDGVFQVPMLAITALGVSEWDLELK